jgi:hypothetical protein
MSTEVARGTRVDLADSWSLLLRVGEPVIGAGEEVGLGHLIARRSMSGFMVRRRED